VATRALKIPDGKGRPEYRLPHEHPLGGNVRRWRLRRGYSQTELAELAGISVNVVRKLEQETGLDSRPRGVRLETLYTLARTLNVQTAQLFSPGSPEPSDQYPTQRALMPIRIALTPPLLITPPSPVQQLAEPDLHALRRQLDESVQFYHMDRYDKTAILLPQMIGLGNRAVNYDSSRGNPTAKALRLRTEILQLTGWFLTQVGAHDLAYQAIKEATADAHAYGDPLAASVSVIGECWLFIRQGRLLDAKRRAAEAADRTEPRLSKATSEELSVWGWLLLMAWASAIRNNQQDEAFEFLRCAKTAAAAIGMEAIRYRHYWTTFGLATVAMKEVEHETIVGNWRNALILAKAVPGTSNTRLDVRHRHDLGLAKAHAELTEYSAAISILAALRKRAPQWLRHQHLGREVTRKILSAQSRALSADMRILADFYDFGA
jgi:transcriptional regulator with XRE-family HTH domain